MLIASFPETLIIATAPTPEAVVNAIIVSLLYVVLVLMIFFCANIKSF